MQPDFTVRLHALSLSLPHSPAAGDASASLSLSLSVTGRRVLSSLIRLDLTSHLSSSRFTERGRRRCRLHRRSSCRRRERREVSAGESDADLMLLPRFLTPPVSLSPTHLLSISRSLAPLAWLCVCVRVWEGEGRSSPDPSVSVC